MDRVMAAREQQNISTVIELLHVIREENQQKHEEMIAHQKETNGRVLKLEKETRIIRWAFNNPKSAVVLLAVIVAGVVVIGSIIPFESLLKLL